MKIYKKFLSSVNILKAAAETTRFRGGDSGHGCQTIIGLEDLGGTDIKFQVGKNGRTLRITLGKDGRRILYN